uniref:Uncharacterized protein n=1 Tax=Amphimedon queenslandica TaxID=400682 RepID=A0A1X7SPQ6_AMPQE
MGRNLRSTIPATKDQLKPHTPSQKKVRFKDYVLKATQKKHYDRRHRSKEQHSLALGDHG